MPLKTVTAALIISIFIIVVIYDVYVWLVGGEPATISWVYMEWVMGRPWLIAAPAYLLGHLTWPQKCVKCGDVVK